MIGIKKYKRERLLDLTKKIVGIEWKILQSALLLLLCLHLHGQELQVPKDQLSQSSLSNLIQGRIYNPFYEGVRGTQYLTLYWRKGSFNLLDQEYYDFPLWYDTYLDELVVLDWQCAGFKNIMLTKHHVKDFSFDGRKFICLTENKIQRKAIPPGYYEVLVEGEVSLYAKRTSIIKVKEYIGYFERKDRWFILHGDLIEELKNRKNFLQVINHQYKGKLEEYIKKEKFKFKKAGDREWALLINHYNELIKENSPGL